MRAVLLKANPCHITSKQVSKHRELKEREKTYCFECKLDSGAEFDRSSPKMSEFSCSSLKAEGLGIPANWRLLYLQTKS